MGLAADAVIRLGRMMISAGTGGYRVMRGIKRTARALGFDRVDVDVTVNSITCTFHMGEQFRTVVSSQMLPGVDASRIEALEDLTHNLRHYTTAADINARLDAIEADVGTRWSSAIRSAAAGFACAGFALLNGFPIFEAVVVTVAAACGQMVRLALGRRHFNQLGTVASAGATACLMYFAITMILRRTDMADSSFAAGYVASALFLIPGFPMFSAMLDLARLDIDAGLSRLTYAITIIITATVTVCAVAWTTGLTPVPSHPPAPSVAWFAAAGGASMVGIAGFALLFNSSKRMVVIAAVIGTIGNLARLGLVGLGLKPHFAALIAGLIIGLIASAIATRSRLPRITMTVPASVIMIPGASLFRSVYYLNAGQIGRAANDAAAAALVVICIAAGLAAARMLTDKSWAHGIMIDVSKPLLPAEPAAASSAPETDPLRGTRSRTSAPEPDRGPGEPTEPTRADKHAPEEGGPTAG